MNRGDGLLEHWLKLERRFLFTLPCRLSLMVFLCSNAGLAGAVEYPNHPTLSRQLKALANSHRSVAHLESVARSIDKREVWLVELGAGSDSDKKKRPAMLLVAGIEGNDLAGTVSAVAWMEHLVSGYEKDDRIKKLLDTTTIYVFPRLNTDAAEYFFAKPKMEVAVSKSPVDEDHDGLVDEDGPDDLNGDGLITWMRVQDPEGEYILDPAEPRLLLKADRAKGEPGAWRLLSEGIDNDKDGQWNEDGLGGVNFNRNFPHNYQFFAPWAGRHPVSEIETRALADFAVAHPNIGVVFAFGAADNLVQTPKSEPGGKKPPTAIHDGDLPFYREFGKAWRETLGLKKELSGDSEPGTFSDWMYFQRGRLALAARAWSPALQLELAKAKAKTDEPKSKEEKAPEKKKPESDGRNEEERAFLKWIDENAPEAFVRWKEIQHPDFPGKKVEVGGFAPFAKTNPPEKLLGELAAQHAKFLTDLAGKLPRIGIRKAEAKPLGEAIYEVTIQVENTGYLPTALAQGSVTREVFPTRLVLKLEDKSLLSGTRTTMLGAIEGSGGMKETRYVVHAKGRKQIEFDVISALGGTVPGTIELQEGRQKAE